MAIPLAAVTMLVDFFSKHGSEIGNQVNGDFKMVEKLYQTIKNKFQGDTNAEKALEAVKNYPDSEKAKDMLTKEIDEKIKDDQTFKRNIDNIVKAYGNTATGSIVINGVSGSNIVFGNNNTSSVVQSQK